jgi:hypothetical protein
VSADAAYVEAEAPPADAVGSFKEDRHNGGLLAAVASTGTEGGDLFLQVFR